MIELYIIFSYNLKNQFFITKSTEFASHTICSKSLKEKMPQIILHLLANCLLLFVQQKKSNSFDEQLKDAKKRLKKSKFFLKKAGNLEERQDDGEKLTEDEETKISKISEFKASIQFYENRIRELESVLNAPSEKKDLEKQERNCLLYTSPSPRDS